MYETELKREPYNFRLWWEYIQSKRDSEPEVGLERYLVIQRYASLCTEERWKNFLEVTSCGITI